MVDISIIISTYQNVEFLKECFDSIIKSKKKYNVEVIVGIDACLETFFFIEKNNFPSYFRFVFFEENQGPYVVFNTLVLECNSENLFICIKFFIFLYKIWDFIKKSVKIIFMLTIWSNRMALYVKVCF